MRRSLFLERRKKATLSLLLNDFFPLLSISVHLYNVQQTLPVNMASFIKGCGFADVINDFDLQWTLFNTAALACAKYK